MVQISESLKASTLLWVELLDGLGMVRLTPDELARKVEPLGYTVHREQDGNYTNGFNEHPYAAKMIGFKDAVTGKSFAHIDGNRDNLPALQAIRYNSYVLDRGRIWEI